MKDFLYEKHWACHFFQHDILQWVSMALILVLLVLDPQWRSYQWAGFGASSQEKDFKDTESWDSCQTIQALKLPSLAFRRMQGDAIEIYKYTHGKYNVSSLPFDLVDEDTQPTRNNGFKIAKKRCSTSVRRDFLGSRAVNPWNSLPSEVVQAPSGLINIGRDISTKQMSKGFSIEQIVYPELTYPVIYEPEF